MNKLDKDFGEDIMRTVASIRKGSDTLANDLKSVTNLLEKDRKNQRTKMVDELVTKNKIKNILKAAESENLYPPYGILPIGNSKWIEFKAFHIDTFIRNTLLFSQEKKQARIKNEQSIHR